MTDTKENIAGKKKMKNKMSKAQMQLAIIKKKQCDAKALLIVERLLEPNVCSEWLLENLKYINKSHMEDVIEERAIIKLCGYVLCEKSLTATIHQQYHISTRKNKVYDITKRKNFCSSKCYGACSFLLEQMLTSPLWLRDKEEIPAFQILPEKKEAQQCMLGEEVFVGGLDIGLVRDDEEKFRTTSKENTVLTKSKDYSVSIANSENEKTINKTDLVPEYTTSIIHGENEDEVKAQEELSEVSSQVTDTEKEVHEIISNEMENTENIEIENTTVSVASSLDEIGDKNTVDNVQGQSNIILKKVSEENQFEKKSVETRIKKCKHVKQKKNEAKQNIKPNEPGRTFYTLTAHIEECAKEWITEETLCLLSGENDAKNRLLENISQHDKYLQLCKKLNKIQLEDEKEDRVDLANNTLKPPPHLSVLQEEGKKMELKVRAFFHGNMVIEQPEATVQKTENNEESVQILPLTDAHAPKAMRRRIFLDKLNRIIPDLLQALTSNKQPYTNIQYTQNERSALIKALVTTFELSATNIIFKSTEWTLVGLIIIKMLSILDPQLKILLLSKQASMYISMILMTYKLDSNYLDRLIIELTNNPEIFNSLPNTVL